MRPFKPIFFTTEKTSDFKADHGTSLSYSLPSGFKKEIRIYNITPNIVCIVSLRISIQIFHNIKDCGEGGKELFLKSDTEINSVALTRLK